MLLYSSSDLYAVFHPGESDFLLITFGFNGMEADDANFWGKAFCAQAKLNALGFMSRRSDWFPSSTMMPAIEEILPHIKDFSNRITYGSSMGGFGAVRYARELGATTTLAYAPQYSIDPTIVGYFDPNFSELFQASLNKGMEPRGSLHVAEHAYILFDPLHVKDREHIRLLKQAAPQITLIPMPHMGHGVGNAFAGTNKITRLIRSAVQHDVAALNKMASDARRSSSLRAGHLALAALRRHPRWAADIVLSHGSTLPSYFLKLIQEAMSRKLAAMRLAHSDDARSLGTETLKRLEQAFRTEFGDSGALLREARKAAAQGQKETAIATLRKLLADAPRYAEGHFHLSGVLLDVKQNDEAARAARRAAELEADNPSYHLRHAIAEERTGHSAEALEAVRRAVSYAPEDAKLREALGAMLMRQGRAAEALETIRKAAALDPNFAPAQNRLSHLAAQFGEKEEALAAAQQVIALDGGEKASTLLALALRYRAMDRLSEAAEAVSRGLVVEPSHPGLQIQARQLQALQPRTG